MNLEQFPGAPKAIWAARQAPPLLSRQEAPPPSCPFRSERAKRHSLVDVGVGVIGEDVVLHPENLHGLLGVFLELKQRPT